MKALLIPILLLSAAATTLFGQTQFANRNDLLAEKDQHSGVPVGIADMNGDGLDDIVTLNYANRLFIQYQTPDPVRPFVRYELPVTLDASKQNDICIADFNNDGANDILTVGFYDRVKVLYSIPYTYSFNLTHILVVPFFSQGASSGDFNHDGWVDVVMLNDNGLNYTLLNDGAGNLVEQDLFDFVTVPTSDNSGNYGSVYSDFDMDGDSDFYIAKCRIGVNSPDDPRRIDVIFVNDGQGNYTEDAANYGLADGHQTWSADFGDIDNDGDLDLFKTQHDIISELFENINNDTFINITSTSGLNIGGVPLQGMLRDFDNDGFQDILVSGDRLDYYHNNGDKTFTKTNPFGDVIFGTFALGDLNNDGFTDVYASTVEPFNNPDPFREDILFLNEKNDNHFLGLHLKDTAGNPSAIGATATLYGSWGIQVREVRGGEQYGVSSGHSIIFGLGDQTTYDSLIIRWPDGSREQYNQLETDKTWYLTRGGCNKQPLDLLQPLIVLCNDDSVIVKIDSEFSIVEWSNGTFADSIIIKEEGLYYATLTDFEGCIVRTSPLEVGVDPDTIRPAITYSSNPQLCDGESVMLSLPSAFSYLWSTGESTQSIAATTTGEYYAEVESFCKNLVSDTVVLEFLIPEVPVTTNDTFLPGESAFLSATGDHVKWYADPFGNFQIGNGNIFQLDNLIDTVTIYARNSVFIDGDDFQVGPTQHEGLTKYNSAIFNGGQLFDVLEPIILHQISVYTDSAGTRSIDINNGVDFFYEFHVDLEPGLTVIDLDVELPVDRYTITTNTDINNQVFGTNSPYLWRSSENVVYPYEIQNVVSIYNSNFGEDFYYYFYDWKITTLAKECSSETVPATAVLDLGTATHQATEADQVFSIVPNPTDGLIQLTLKTEGTCDVEILRMDGVRVLRQLNIAAQDNTIQIDMSAYPSGVYLISVNQYGRMFTQKIVRL